MIGKLTVLALLSVGHGFMLPLAGRRASVSNINMMSVQTAAEACLEEECSLDTVEDLLRELKATSQTATGKEKAQALEMYSQLKFVTVDVDGDRKKNEIEKIVGSISRTFGTVEAFEFPGPAVGYSGKPSHPTTAGK